MIPANIGASPPSRRDRMEDDDAVGRAWNITATASAGAARPNGAARRIVAAGSATNFMRDAMAIGPVHPRAPSMWRVLPNQGVAPYRAGVVLAHFLVWSAHVSDGVGGVARDQGAW